MHILDSYTKIQSLNTKTQHRTNIHNILQTQRAQE